jgi:hypothetical protein
LVIEKEIKWWGMLDLNQRPPGYAGPDRIGRVQGR